MAKHLQIYKITENAMDRASGSDGWIIFYLVATNQRHRGGRDGEKVC